MFAGAATDRQRFVINGVINAVLWNFPSTPLMITKSLHCKLMKFSLAHISELVLQLTFDERIL